MANKVIHALELIGTPRFAAIDIRELGDEVDAHQLEVSSKHAGTYTTMVKLEIGCDENEVGRTMNVIAENARSGDKGNGIIVVSPAEEVIKIPTDSRQKSQKEFGKP